jgi:hypothetical protein
MRTYEHILSPKKAARETYRRLLGGVSIRDIESFEHTSNYDAERHEAYPRAIELKPRRFAIQAKLGAQVADRIVVGTGREARIPAFERMRNLNDATAMYSEVFFSPRELAWLRLSDSWSEIDFTDPISHVLHDPRNADLIHDYQEIVEDTITDPDAKEDYLEDSAEKDLFIRLNPRHSFELELSSYFLLKWGTELAPPQLYNTREKRRHLLLDNIRLFTEMAELEINHSNKYFLSKWNDRSLTAEQAGVHLTQDYTGNYRLALRERVSRPERTFGKPIGCPMGFGSVIENYLTAIVNEANDRKLI